MKYFLFLFSFLFIFSSCESGNNFASVSDLAQTKLPSHKEEEGLKNKEPKQTAASSQSSNSFKNGGITGQASLKAFAGHIKGDTDKVLVKGEMSVAAIVDLNRQGGGQTAFSGGSSDNVQPSDDNSRDRKKRDRNRDRTDKQNPNSHKVVREVTQTTSEGEKKVTVEGTFKVTVEGVGGSGKTQEQRRRDLAEARETADQKSADADKARKKAKEAAERKRAEAEAARRARKELEDKEKALAEARKEAEEKARIAKEAERIAAEAEKEKEKANEEAQRAKLEAELKTRVEISNVGVSLADEGPQTKLDIIVYMRTRASQCLYDFHSSIIRGGGLLSQLWGFDWQISFARFNEKNPNLLPLEWSNGNAMDIDKKLFRHKSDYVLSKGEYSTGLSKSLLANTIQQTIDEKDKGRIVKDPLYGLDQLLSEKTEKAVREGSYVVVLFLDYGDDYPWYSSEEWDSFFSRHRDVKLITMSDTRYANAGNLSHVLNEGYNIEYIPECSGNRFAEAIQEGLE